MDEIHYSLLSVENKYDSLDVLRNFKSRIAFPPDSEKVSKEMKDFIFMNFSRLNREVQNEERAWDNTMNKNDLAAYYNYLEEHPEGKYKELAKERISVITSPPPTPNNYHDTSYNRGTSQNQNTGELFNTSMRFTLVSFHCIQKQPYGLDKITIKVNGQTIVEEHEMDSSDVISLRSKMNSIPINQESDISISVTEIDIGYDDNIMSFTLSGKDFKLGSGFKEGSVLEGGQYKLKYEFTKI